MAAGEDRNGGWTRNGADDCDGLRGSPRLPVDNQYNATTKRGVLLVEQQLMCHGCLAKEPTTDVNDH